MYRIGIDLGGTNIAAGVVDESQHIVAEVSIPTGAERSPETVAADICRAAEMAMEKAGITAAHCASIGIGSPGTCDSRRGVVVRAYNLGWFDVPVCDMVTRKLGLPCRLSNDANCAALAETVAGAAIGSSRPVAETLRYLPLNRYVGMSGQKFTGNLYIACGISGASQHLKGIKDASTIVAINKNGNAPIFKNCDYGIVGDVEEILPLLTAALDSGEKLPAPPMVKMKRPTPPKPAPIGDRYVCSGCGYEYVPELGDEDGEIAPGTLFEQLPAEWVCPECAETKDQFVKA